MSFFELDGGGKAKARKSTKPKATKKAPAKKSSGKKKTKTKKGGNFLGTVSELFAPAGWENFVTAAGLLALDRTDNYLRKSKDSKKQRGGADDATTPSKTDDTPTEEMESFTSRMSGGARKRSSSRKQRGGSDSHYSTSDLIEMMKSSQTSQSGGARKRSSSRKHRGGNEDSGDATNDLDQVSEDNDMTSQTGGAKKRVAKKSKGRKQQGGMTDEEKVNFLTQYSQQTQNEKNAFLSQYQQNPEAMGLVTAYNSINKNSFQSNPESNRNKQIINKAIQNQQASMRQSVNTSEETPLSIFNNANSNKSKGLQQSFEENRSLTGNTSSSTGNNPSLTGNTSSLTGNTSSLSGGKPKSKSKSKSKSKPKAKKSAPKRK